MAPRKKYYVGKSKIHGEGSFAKKDLSAGEYIGKAHTVKKLYSDYDFTELGMKHNHSENPSTLDVEIGNERHLIAKRPIKKGEELTTNYRVLQDLKQPEDFENGGWLDKYDAPQAQNGIEGTMGGLTDKGFNYNGAWGGPSMQGGGYVDSVLNANKNLDWVQRLYEKKTPSVRVPGQKGRSTHFMESANSRVYPTVVRMPGGKLKYLGDNAYNYADSTKTYIQFPSDKEAQWFGENYKKGTGVLKGFQTGGNLMPAMAGAVQTVPMAQLGDSVKPVPMQLAMGGSLPGAVGFTYARTAGAAPANGPYAKKTKASAQNGAKIPVIEDAGSFNKEGVWIPDWEKMTAQAKKLGAKKVRTKHGSVIYFNDKWEVSSVDDNPDAKAQNGQEMKYYQEGLDFKPKTISKNGGWLDKYNAPQARDGNDILEYLKKDKTAPVVTKGKPLTADQQKRITAETLKRQTQKNKPLTATNTREQAVERGRAENLRVIEENKEAEEQAMAEGKAAEATRENPNVPFTFPTGETKLWKDMDWRERQYVSGRNLGSMSRFNNWTDWINPITMIGEMGEGLATAPYMARVTESNLPYVAGIASPLLGGALGGLGTRSTGQFANNMLNPVAGMDLSFNKIGEKITNTMLSPFPKSTQSAIRSFNIGLNRGIGEVLSGRPISETFPITKKQIELAKQKATQEHAQGSRFARDWYYDTKGAIRPEVEQKIENILKSKGAPFENAGYYPNYKTFGTSSYAHAGPMGQAYTFISNPLAETPNVLVGSSTKSISESNFPDYVRKYLLEERHRIGGVNYGNAQFTGPSITLFGQGPNYYRPSIVGDIAVHEAGHTAQNLGGMGYDPITGYPSHMYGTWGEVTTTTDPDYKYFVPNLNTELGQRFGKAMIEPEKGKYTWAASPNELHSDLMMARLRTHKNLMNQGLDYQTAINKLQKETMTDDAMVDEIIRQGSLNRFFKKDTPIEEKRALIRLLPAAVPAVGAASMLGGESEQPPKQQYGGDIPVDPMGYWNPENVGGPVTIPSNVISMEGVDQPLLGISDTGDVQYMMPGEDYEFDGEYVTEYPMAKKGISVNNADAQPLKKLDQLLNFTNYNKPTKGGWLDKYN